MSELKRYGYNGDSVGPYIIPRHEGQYYLATDVDERIEKQAEEIRVLKVTGKATRADVAAFLKSKGLFNEYYEGAGDWEVEQ